MGSGGETVHSPSPACQLSSTEQKQQESQVPATEEGRGVCSCQHWPRTEPASCPPRPGGQEQAAPPAHSQLYAAALPRPQPFSRSPLIFKTHALVLVLQPFIKCLIQPSSQRARAFSSILLGLSSQEPADPEHNCKTQECQQGAYSSLPKAEVFQNVLASFLPCSPICKEVTQELQGLCSNQPGLYPHSVYRKLRAHTAPRAVIFCPSLLLASFIPAGATPCCQKQHCRISKLHSNSQMLRK